MIARRNFLQSGAVAAIQPGPRRSMVEQARALVRSGALGRVGFCRIGDPALRPAAQAVSEPLTSGCIIEVDPDFEGVAFLGSRATLVIDRAGCRVFPEST